MKRVICLVIALAVLYVNGHAQLSQSSKIIGGFFSMSYTPNNSHFSGSLNPYAEYFVIDNLALGGSTRISYSGGQNSSSISLSFSPAAHYYFPVEGNLKPFIQAYIGYSVTYFDYAGDPASNALQSSGKSDGFSAGGGPGVTYFVDDNIGLSMNLSYGESFNQSNSSGFVSSDYRYLNLGIGLQIFMP